MNRLAKQLIIGGVYLAIIFGLSWFVYRAFVPAPTCTDGIQNGKEDGVDCGALACGILCPVAVKPLENSEPVIIKTGPSSYDVLAHLENPNATYGASRVDYVLTVTDAQGNEIASRRGSTYVNPAQPRYLLFPLQGLTIVPAKAALVFSPTNVTWAALSIDAAGDVQFAVRNDRFTATSASAQFEATIGNVSKFNFDAVDVTVLVYDSNGKIVGANATVQHTVVSGEQRAFLVQWPFPVPGAVRAQAIVTTNVFANDNFIRTYGAPGSIPGI
ncbi:MAG: FxLYD domain-containing protein [Patescibacteria group bacterium]